MTVHSAALVGTVGGAGTTRLAVELGAVLARAGRRALVLDLDFDTQGLAGRIPGRLAPDSTRLLTDPDTELVDAVYEADIETPGRLDLCPAHAPFTRVADAKATAAAQRLGGRLADARSLGYDAVLMDTPPIASNPAVAAVTAADRTALIATPDERGVDAIQRARGRLGDVNATVDACLMTRAGTDPDTTPADHPDAKIVLPNIPHTGHDAGPDALADSPYAEAVVSTAEALFDTDLDIEFESPGRFQSIREALS